MQVRLGLQPSWELPAQARPELTRALGAGVAGHPRCVSCSWGTLKVSCLF